MRIDRERERPPRRALKIAGISDKASEKYKRSLACFPLSLSFFSFFAFVFSLEKKSARVCAARCNNRYNVKIDRVVQQSRRSSYGLQILFLPCRVLRVLTYSPAPFFAITFVSGNRLSRLRDRSIEIRTMCPPSLPSFPSPMKGKNSLPISSVDLKPR